MVGIADVDAFVPKQTPIDQHAARETTTVYTGVRNFPMLPEELSTGITSLLENQDRAERRHRVRSRFWTAISSPPTYIAPSCAIRPSCSTIRSARGWKEGRRTAQGSASSELQHQLKLQDEVAQQLKEQRYQHGALNLQTDEVHPLVLNDQVVDVVKQQKNRATDLIEDFMVAANGVVARMLENVSSLRRIVRTPERWDRIVQLAATRARSLPAQPDSKALNDFLLRRKAADPDHFADLSLAVIKLIGPGEYVLERAGERRSRDISAWRCRTTRTPPRPIAVSRMW